MVREVGPCEVASSTGGFHSISEIGEGGFGKVYRAMLNQRPVAIKVNSFNGNQGASKAPSHYHLTCYKKILLVPAA